ncbi:MAG: SseB family protein [Elusimicrobia bacterium]|nr:SseB family protein [Elusimicrobiota bacterium]
MNNLEPQFAFDNQKVEDALTRLAGEDNRRARHALYQAFLESILIVPMAENGNSATLEEIRLLQNSQGKKALAVFTSTSAWRCWKPQEKCWAAAKGSDLIDAARKMGAEAVVINIAGPGPKGFLTKSEIEIMRQAALSGKKLAEAADTRENSQELDLDVEQPPQNLSRELIGFLKINLDLQPQAQSAF